MKSLIKEMLSPRVSYQQLALVFLLALAICYAIPFSKYDPFLMSGKDIYPRADFTVVVAVAVKRESDPLLMGKKSDKDHCQDVVGLFTTSKDGTICLVL
uniref:Uncharacterized protein n=1 Tax=Onchocerca volvulus TaxID=6282 RepID=A0A8R1XTK0_ONCVO